MPAMSQEALLDWLSGSLEEERRSQDFRHQSLVEDMKLKLEALCASPGNDSSGIAREEVWGAPLGNLPAEAKDSSLGNLPAEAKDLSQITPKEEEPSTLEKEPSTAQMAHAAAHAQKVLIDHHLHETHDIFQKIVFNKRFEWIFGLIILMHILVMCAESQYVGLGVGYDIGYPGYSHPRTEAWPAGESFFFGLDFIFGILYTIELLLKILALRVHFIDAWNLLDVLIVGLWYVEKMTANVKLPIDTMLLRLLRLAKLLRLIKVLKSLTGFDQLFLMLTALKGSFRILCWVACILFTCLIAFSLLGNQLLVANLLENEDVSLKKKLRAFKYFGTFSRALFSMFEMTLANWTGLGRFLLDDVNEFVGMTTIIYKLTMGFTVIAVINACFIKETFKIAEQDDLLMVLEKDQERKVHAAKMMKLLDMADTKGDGTLTRDEFVTICKDPEVDKWLGAQGLRVTDAGAIFDLIDEGEGLVHKEELVAGARRLQGMSRSLDVAKNQLQLGKNHDDLISNHDNLIRNHDDLQSGIQKVLIVLGEHSHFLRGVGRNSPQPSSSCSTEAPTDFASVQGMKELQQELSLVKDDIREVKGLLSVANLQKLSTSMRVPRQPELLVQDTASKVMWGCS